MKLWPKLHWKRYKASQEDPSELKAKSGEREESRASKGENVTMLYTEMPMGRSYVVRGPQNSGNVFIRFGQAFTHGHCPGNVRRRIQTRSGGILSRNGERI
jgi:hypothetical protein